MMKRTIRILSLLVVLVMCFSFCGCGALDELRQSQASITPEGTIRLVDGTEYKMLPECEELTPRFDNADMVYVAEEELPLLLTIFSDVAFYKSDDGIFLESQDEETYAYYCRTDVYDTMLERINSGFIAETYGYWYYDYEQENDVFYTLTPTQADVLLKVCKTQASEQLPVGASFDYEYMADIVMCTKDRLFVRDMVSVCVVNGNYYAVEYNFDNTVFYRVPNQQAAVFAEILQAMVESDSYWEEW